MIDGNKLYLQGRTRTLLTRSKNSSLAEQPVNQAEFFAWQKYYPIFLTA